MKTLFLYVSILWLLMGCITLQPQRMLVERNKKHTPSWIQKTSGVLPPFGEVPHFLYVKRNQTDIEIALKQTEAEGRAAWHRMLQGPSLSLIFLADIYYEARLDTHSRDKQFDVYMLFTTHRPPSI